MNKQNNSISMKGNSLHWINEENMGNSPFLEKFDVSSNNKNIRVVKETGPVNNDIIDMKYFGYNPFVKKNIKCNNNSYNYILSRYAIYRRRR